MTASRPTVEEPGSPRLLQWARELSPLDERSITVLVDVSNKCNIRCRMCYFHFDSVFHRKSEFLSPESFRSIAERLFPRAHTVYLSAGNEPLTSPHFAELLRIAAPYQVPDLKFLTNALLVTPEIAEAIVISGVHQVHISIDGATEETYERIRVGGKFARLKQGVRLLSEARARHGSQTPHLQFNITLMRSNLQELTGFVDLAQELGVTRIAARHLIPYEGLDIEDETLDHIKPEANRRFGEFLEYAARSGQVSVVNWPDFFNLEGDAPQHAGVAGPQRAVTARKPAATDQRRGDQVEPEHPATVSSPEEPDQPLSSPAPRALLGGEEDHQQFGSLDFPPAPVVAGSEQVVLSGWALDSRGVERVHVSREPFPGEALALDDFGLVPLGQARILPGARPDVVFTYPDARHRFRHAFTYTLERQGLPATLPFAIQLHVIAETAEGHTFEVGQRRVVYDGVHEAAPPRTCEKPFENVYIDSAGNVYPYPDCQTVDPFGSINEAVPFEEIWFGEAFTELRTRILAGDPPEMCLNCPNFINRNVDDRSFFASREVESDFRKPQGFLDTPDQEQVLGRAGLTFRGWALGFEEFRGVQVEAAVHEDSSDALPLGEATFVEGTRPDVARNYRRLARAERAGWSFTLLPEDLAGLPGKDKERITLVFRAVNEDGSSTLLGRRQVKLQPRS